MKLKSILTEVESKWELERKQIEIKLNEFSNGFMTFLKGKKLGSMPVEGLKVEQPGMISFITRIDGLQLNWLIRYGSTMQKEIIDVSVSSPNRRGYFEKKVTGGNANPQGTWNLINKIFNGHYSR